jgi:hypothetical protein
MLIVPHCTHRGSAISDIDGLSAFQSFAMQLVTVCQGFQSQSGIYGLENIILSLPVIGP